jgi:hypothetical protein
MNALLQKLPEPAAAPNPQIPPRERLRLCPPPHDVPAAAVDRFAANQASPEERRAVIRHLLAGCHQCKDRLLARWTPAPLPESAYDGAFERSMERCLAQSATVAAGG